MNKQPSDEPAQAENAAVAELDLRGLEPAQPMIEILSTLERMKSGRQLVAILPRRPVYLLPHIEAAACPYALHQRDDQTWELRVTKA